MVERRGEKKKGSHKSIVSQEKKLCEKKEFRTSSVGHYDEGRKMERGLDRRAF